MAAGEPPQKSRSVTTAFVTLQRPPPLTRIFAPGLRAPSTSSTERLSSCARAKIAVAKSAAPAPTITVSHAFQPRFGRSPSLQPRQHVIS